MVRRIQRTRRISIFRSRGPRLPITGGAQTTHLQTSGKTWTVSVYLLRAGIRDAADALNVALDALDAYRLTSVDTEAVLYVSTTPPMPPAWVSLFNGITDRPLQLSRPAFAAVLLLPVRGRLFALTFGQAGRFLLRTGSYERDFGLHAARNLVDPEQIRSVQSRRFADTALQVRRQLARPADIIQLDMDVQQDLLTTLEGAVIEGSAGKRVRGADAVRFTDHLSVTRLPGICGTLLDAAGASDYKKRYPWADQVTHITDSLEAESLEKKVLSLLLEGEFHRFDVYPPEMVDDAVVDFGINSNTTVMEPTSKLLGKLIERSGASQPEELANWLRSSHISARDDEGTIVGRWSWWECLYFESRDKEQTAVLDRGVWLRIRRDFAEIVNRFAAALEPSDLKLPSALRTDLEADYNERVPTERTDIRLLDRKLIAPIPGESRVEICDLFCDRGHLVHVKRRKGGSSGLSHLFAQALVSSQLLARAPQFATAMRDQLRDWAHCVREPPARAEHPVVLGVLLAAESSGQGARALPFFAKVALRQNVQHIQGMGFPVFFDEIPAPLTIATGQRAGGPKPARRRAHKR
jgi:uncharacterized protein (TIGR04141 family)